MSHAKGRSGDPVRWLNAEELRAWRATSRAMAKLSWALECQLQREAGLSFVEYHALAMLSEQPDHTARMSELAELTNASLSRLSHLISRLERRDLVRREPDPHNGRFTNAVLTEAGYAKLVASAPGHVTKVRTLVLDTFSAEEFRHLGAGAERLLDRLEGRADGPG